MKRTTKTRTQPKFWEQDDELKKQVQKLVLARIMVLPENMRLSIGSSDFTRDELMQHVRHDDDIGRQVAAIQLEFLQDLASGAIYHDEQEHPLHEAQS